MDNQLHLVLGGNGAVGSAVITELRNRALPVKGVERFKDILGVETIHADLLTLSEAKKAVMGASHVYLCIGLPYQSDVWSRDWPKIMHNVIEACAATDAVLIFFDNVYMYGPAPLSVPFDEHHPQHPTTKKGRVRKVVADILLTAHRAGTIRAVIGRSADFYGPNAVNSPFYISFLERMLQSKNPQSINKPDVPHTYAYTEDNGRALVSLALDTSTYGEVWHLPVGEPITIDEIATLFNKEMGTTYTVSYLSDFMLTLLSFVIRPVKEAREMSYQFDTPYTMSFDAFKRKFPDFTVTSYRDGVKKMVASFRDRTA